MNGRHRRRGRDRSHGRRRDKSWHGWGTHNTTHCHPLSAQQTPPHNKKALSRAAQAENKCHNTWRKLQPTATCKLQTFRELSYWKAFQEEITRHESFLQILQKKNTLSVWQAAVPAPPVREEKTKKKGRIASYIMLFNFKAPNEEKGQQTAFPPAAAASVKSCNTH